MLCQHDPSEPASLLSKNLYWNSKNSSASTWDIFYVQLPSHVDADEGGILEKNRQSNHTEGSISVGRNTIERLNCYMPLAENLVQKYQNTKQEKNQNKVWWHN